MLLVQADWIELKFLTNGAVSEPMCIPRKAKNSKRLLQNSSHLSSNLNPYQFLDLLRPIAETTLDNEPQTQAYAWFEHTEDDSGVPDHWVRGFEMYATLNRTQEAKLRGPFQGMRRSKLARRPIARARSTRRCVGWQARATSLRGRATCGICSLFEGASYGGKEQAVPRCKRQEQLPWRLPPTLR